MDVCCDYHVHTRFSIDGQQTMMAMCQGALQRGLQEICFTEHVDWVAWDPSREYFKPDEYMAEVERCRAAFAGQLTIRAGVEVGEPHLVAQDVAALLAAWPFDFVLGSIHWVGQIGVHLPDFYDGRQPAQADAAYLAQVLALVEQADFDSLGHLDVVKRYRPARLGPFDPQAHADIIRAILRAIVRRDKAIEINTSPLRQGLATTCPDLTVLRWYRQLGGERLTLGSDAHRPQDVGAGLDVAKALARAAGFTRLVRFERRQAKWVSP